MSQRKLTPPRAFLDQGGELLGAQLTLKLTPKLNRRTLGPLEAEEVFDGDGTLFTTLVHHLRV
jgi:hypothetical protein